jgi:hypothetical protein
LALRKDGILRWKLTTLGRGAILAFVIAFALAASVPMKTAVHDHLASKGTPILTTGYSTLGCAVMQDVHTGQWASDYPDVAWLYFVTATTHRTVYCPRIISNGPTDPSGDRPIEIQDDTAGSGYGRCLAAVLDNNTWKVATYDKATCDAEMNSSAMWFPMPAQQILGSGPVKWVFQNVSINACIYDDGQEPAIMTTNLCNLSNEPQEFAWGALGLPTPQ